MPAERKGGGGGRAKRGTVGKGVREQSRERERSSEPGAHTRTPSDLADSRSVKHRDGGDPTRHGRPRTLAETQRQSRPSGGRDKDESRDSFRRANRRPRSAREDATGGRNESKRSEEPISGTAPRRIHSRRSRIPALRGPIVIAPVPTRPGRRGRLGKEVKRGTQRQRRNNSDHERKRIGSLINNPVLRRA